MKTETQSYTQVDHELCFFFSLYDGIDSNKNPPIRCVPSTAELID